VCVYIYIYIYIYICILFSFFLAPFPSVHHFICFASLSLPYCVIVFQLYRCSKKRVIKVQAKKLNSFLCKYHRFISVCSSAHISALPFTLPTYLSTLCCHATDIYIASPSITNTSVNALLPHYWRTYCFPFSNEHISQHSAATLLTYILLPLLLQHISQRSVTTLLTCILLPFSNQHICKHPAATLLTYILLPLLFPTHPSTLCSLITDIHIASPSLTNTSLNTLLPHYWHTYCFPFSNQHISQRSAATLLTYILLPLL